jgi:hypothetical protein
MADQRVTTDCHGKKVRVGDRVRLRIIEGNLLEALPKDEIEDVRSMIGEIFKVEDIDEHGFAWISKWWDRGEGRRDSHSLALSASEIELVVSETAS